MAYFISTDCIGCGLCQANCPAGAIGFNQQGRREIKQEACVQCGTCFENCPVEAIEEK